MTTKSYRCGRVHTSIQWHGDDAEFAHIQPTAQFSPQQLEDMRKHLFVRKWITPKGMTLRSNFTMNREKVRAEKPLVKQHLFLSPIVQTLHSNHFQDGQTDTIDDDEVPVIRRGHESATYFLFRIIDHAIELSRNKNLRNWECPFYSYAGAMQDVIADNDDIEEIENPPLSMRIKHPMQVVDEGDDDCLLTIAPRGSVDVGQPMIKTEDSLLPPKTQRRKKESLN